VTLIDSTKYISWMRTGRSPVALLAPLLRSGTLISCAIIRIEVLRGMVKPATKKEIESLFDSMPEVPIDAGITKKAADLAWQLDRKGCVLPVTDIIIAACSLRIGATVITEDPHFDHIEGLVVRRDLS
jgi:predicted nucleic acid-binding protein